VSRITRGYISKVWTNNMIVYAQDTAHAAKWLTDWMHLFPGVKPQWISEGGWGLLTGGLSRMFKKMPDDHDWGEARRQSDAVIRRRDTAVAPEDFHTNLVPRYDADGWDTKHETDKDGNPRFNEKDSRAPAPGKLYKIVKELQKRFQINYENSFQWDRNVIFFEPIEGKLAVRMAGAHKFIGATVYFGQAYRVVAEESGNGVAAYIFDGKSRATSNFHKKLATPAAVRDNLNWAISGGKSKYQLSKISTDRLPKMSRPTWEEVTRSRATPAILFEDLAEHIKPLLTPSQIFPVADDKQIWEVFRYLKMQSAKGMLLLVEGLFMYIDPRKSISVGTPLEPMSQKRAGFDDWNQDLQTVVGEGLKHLVVDNRIFSQRVKRRSDLGTVVGHFRVVHKDWARRWKLLEREDGELHSLVDDMTVDEVLDNLRKSLHARAVAAFAPEEA